MELFLQKIKLLQIVLECLFGVFKKIEAKIQNIVSLVEMSGQLYRPNGCIFMKLKFYYGLDRWHPDTYTFVLGPHKHQYIEKRLLFTVFFQADSFLVFTQVV